MSTTGELCQVRGKAGQAHNFTLPRLYQTIYGSLHLMSAFVLLAFKSKPLRMRIILGVVTVFVFFFKFLCLGSAAG